MAGNSSTSEAITQNTADEGMLDDELSEEIGKYVDYTPVSGVFTSQSIYSGVSNKTFSTQTNLKWRILFVDENKLTLIADTTTANADFSLGGANGYNNGVLLLNETCKALYSNTPLGAEGRSLNIDDIERVSSYDKTTFTSDGFKYGTEYSATNRYYPNIYQYEITGAPNCTYGTLYDLSEQTAYATGEGYTNSSGLRGKWTYYTYTIGTNYMDISYVELFRYEPTEWTDLKGYWLASRCVYYGYDDWFEFRMFYVSGGTVDAYDLYDSDDYDYNDSYAVRPVDSTNLGCMY